MVTSYSEWVNYEQEKVKYIKFQREKCPTTNKLHWQIYVVFMNPQTMKGAKNILKDDSCHLDICKGSEEECVAYVSKAETAVPNSQYEYGERSKQGKRSDLESLYDDVKDGTNLKDIVDKYPAQYIRYHAGIEKIINLQSCIRDRTQALEVFVYYGPPGSGKTRAVYDAHNIEDIYVKDVESKWWDGYSSHKIILIDDFDGEEMSYRYLLRLLDRYQFKGQVKGGYVNINADRIYITSNRSPDKWYPYQVDEMDWTKITPLSRRITKLIKFG